MPCFVVRFAKIGLVSAVLAGLSCAVNAASGSAVSRELAIRHDMRSTGAVTTSVKGTIRVNSASGAAALRTIRAADYLGGGQPETFTATLIRANGYEQPLPITDHSTELGLPRLYSGDTIQFEGRSRTAGLQFGSGFVASQSFPVTEGYEKVEITISAPSLRNVRHMSRMFDERFEMNSDGESLRLVLKGGQVTYGVERETVIHPIAQYSVSTLESPKALDAILVRDVGADDENSPTVVALTQTLTEGANHKLEVANAILDWLRMSVRREGKTLMASHWPPRPASAILASRAGSPVEIARLYRTMLASRGIASTLVLSYRHDVTERQRVAVPDMDGVLLHMTNLDLYAEFTADFPVNGALNPSFAGRPALKITPTHATAFRFPDLTAASNKIRVISEMSVGSNGAVSGQTRAEGIGPISALMQANIRKLAQMSPAERSRLLLERQNLTGQAEIFHADSISLGKAYVSEMDFRIDGETGKDGSLSIPVFAGPRYLKNSYIGFVAALRDEGDLPFRCFSEDLTQDIVIHMPDAYPLPQLPGNISVELTNARYSAEYSFVGRALRVSRRLVLDLPSTLCTKEMAKEMAPALRAAARDMARKVVVRGPED